MEKYRKILDKLANFTNSREYDKAIEFLDQELIIDPKNATLWWAKGKTISMSAV